MQPIVAIYLLWGVWILTWLAAAAGVHYAPRKLSKLQNFVYRMTTLVATLLLFTITPWPGFDVQYRFWDRALTESWSWVLVGMAFLGFSLAWWSTVHRMAVHRWHKDVVDNGPYGVVRHPIYVGLIIAAFATAVMFGRPSSMAGAVVLAIAFFVKILIEEQALREENYAYDDYIGRVPMLVPFFPTRDKPVRQAKADRIEPTLLRASSVEPVAARDEERVGETAAEPVDESDEELFSDAVTEPVTAPADHPEKPPLVERDKKLSNDLGLTPIATKAVQLTLLLDDSEQGAERSVLSDATTKD